MSSAEAGSNSSRAEGKAVGAVRRARYPALLVLSAAAVAGGGLAWELMLLRLRVALADEQTAIFEQMRAQALRSGPAEAAGCLDYAVNYYPSGTKQEAGSRLDRVVERHRVSAVRDIIAHLRSKTGQDHGDDPRAWVERFAAR